MRGFLLGINKKEERLLNLGFFVFNVFTHDWIELHQYQLFRLGTLVLGSGVKVASAGSRFEFDFIAHEVLRE